MPTGYTSEIYNGKELSLKEFALTCARQFGACIRLRDEPITGDIPVFEPERYHLDELEKNKQEQQAFFSMTEDQLREQYQKEVEEDRQHIAQMNEQSQQIKKRYDKLLLEVRQWVPPTPDHHNLKTFMIDQIERSYGVDCFEYKSHMPTTFEKWKEDKINKFIRDDKYHREGYEKECTNVARSNAWVNALKGSF